MEVSREAEENANKHERVLEEAFSNLLVQSGSHTKVRLISSERAETILRRDLLAFYSRQMREIIVSLSKTVTCSPDSDLVVHMPEFSMLTIIKLRSLLEEGFVRGHSSEGEIGEVLEAALSLGVDMDQLGLGGEMYPAAAILPTPIPITPLITSTISVKEEIVYQDQSGDQTGEQPLLFTSDQGQGMEQEEPAEANPSQPRPPSQQGQFGCQKCRKHSKSLKNLKTHYIVEHYSKDLSQWIHGNLCLECSATFQNPTKLLIHVGSAHKKVEELLARDGLFLDNSVSQNEVGSKSTVSPSSSKSKSKQGSRPQRRSPKGETSRAEKKSPKGKNISVKAADQPLALTQDNLMAEEEPTAAAGENITLELGGTEGKYIQALLSLYWLDLDVATPALL